MVVLGVASVVAVRSLSLRREHEEEMSMMAARVSRFEAERDEARNDMLSAKERLLNEAPEAIRVIYDGSSRRSSPTSSEELLGWMNKWISDAFETKVAAAGDEINSNNSGVSHKDSSQVVSDKQTPMV